MTNSGRFRDLGRAADRLCAYDHCRLPLPWFIWSGRTDATSRLRRCILELDYGRPLASAGLLKKTLAAGLHATRVTRELFLTWHRWHAACRQGYGVPGRHQLTQLFIAVFRYNFPPSLYYRARLFRLARSRWCSLFSHGETTTLLVLMERHTEHRGLWTKSGWTSFCTEQGIPCAPICARVIDGKLTVLDPGALRAGQDLFLKPDRAWASHGAIMLEWHDIQRSWHAIGATEGVVPEDGIAGFLIKASDRANLVVQPRLRTMPDLADLAPRALINIRVVTVRKKDGTVSVITAALRIPSGAEHSSDVPGSGLFIPVYIATGALGRAESPRMELGTMPRHPYNQAVIEGRLVVQWPEMRTRAIAAHACLPFVPTVGWDLVATDRGVLILEANAVWSANLAQHRGLAPLGETSWPAIMLEYFSGLDCIATTRTSASFATAPSC